MVRGGTIKAMGDLLVRPGGPEDAEAIYAIHRESAMAAYVHVFPPDRYEFPDDQMRRHWNEALRDAATEVVIAEREGRPVGFATVSPGWLRNLFVVPEEWGRGAAAAIHDEAVARLRTMDAGARLWVLEANERARRFYERRGWRPDGERSTSEYPPYPPTLRYALDLAQ
jgi:RimJ/RimL family protein N-acetyltransferase